MVEKVLIIDASATSRIALKARLALTYATVREARSAEEGLQSLRDGPSPDLILLGDTLLSVPTAELIAQLRADPAGQHAAIVALTRHASRSHRARLLEAGADDVAPLGEREGRFNARLRSLLRARAAAEELRLRDATGTMLGLAETAETFRGPAPPARVVVVTRQPAVAADWAATLARHSTHEVTALSITEALRGTRGSAPDVYVIDIDTADKADVAALISGIRAREETRHAEVLALTRDRDTPVAADALDLGAGALMSEGFDPAEMLLRLQILMRRKRTGAALRQRLADGMRASVTDPLTGLYNRRYALSHLARMIADAAGTGRPFAVALADIDHFKTVNDRFGHAAGDVALIAVADLLRDNLRSRDMVARIGGEEFLIAMPDTGRAEAEIVAERLRRRLAETPIPLPAREERLHCTLSLGVALAGPLSDTGAAPAPGIGPGREQSSGQGNGPGAMQGAAPRTRSATCPTAVQTAAHAPASGWGAGLGVASPRDALPHQPAIEAAAEHLIARADRALYEAKALGRDRVSVSPGDEATDGSPDLDPGAARAPRRARL
ncbi:diguanylate cyclase [Maritimibacter alkaliphilus]|uniref:diguanylate cyclase n=1 Tax=Maritimibacter alkaliphilus TaxID=404236 RepID=UPI001C93A6DD|nr:diguanylate cyclase [Maritimibacter alkaliphilus]MBY6089099.1 diguanylate cyclase [Maritimibacter alkaliphilus]